MAAAMRQYAQTRGAFVYWTYAGSPAYKETSILKLSLPSSRRDVMASTSALPMDQESWMCRDRCVERYPNYYLGSKQVLIRGIIMIAPFQPSADICH